MENEIEIFKDADYCRQVVEAMRVCVNEFGANSAKGNETSEEPIRWQWPSSRPALTSPATLAMS